MKALPFVFFVFVLSCSHSTQEGSEGSKVYSCQTEFGQTVPVDFYQELPEQRSVQAWNAELLEAQGLGTSIKKHVLNSSAESYVLRTRYVKQAGPQFRFSLSCPEGERCEMSFLPQKKQLKLKPIDEPDSRLLDTKPYATVQIAARNEVGFIVRMFRRDKSQKILSSGSGEIKIFSPQPRYSLDVGTDEAFSPLPELQVRLASLEIKIECEVEGYGLRI